MDRVKVSMDYIGNSTKPSGDMAARINNRVGKNVEHLKSANFDEFTYKVGKCGYTFCPATFKDGKRRRENFEQLQLLVLDFDGGVTFEKVIKRAEEYELPMLFAYDTLTSVNHDKFRVVFLNNASISDMRIAGAMLQALTTIFPEADPCSKDISRMYYGGKGLLHYDDSTPEINIESLFRNMSLFLKDKYGITHYKSKIAEFSRKTGIALNKSNQLDITVAENVSNPDGNSSPNTTIMLAASGGKLPYLQYLVNMSEDSTSTSGDKIKPGVHLPYRSSVLKNISSSCRLYQEFVSGKRKLHHNELFGLATNLSLVESGSAQLKETIRYHSYYDDRPKKYIDWDYYLHYVKDYKPFSCDGFCPYKNLCRHGTNMLSTSKPGYHQIEKLANYVEHFVPIKEAEEDFEKALNEAMDATKKLWYIIKAQTAIGKTETYLRLLKSSPLRILIAVPTNKLKGEVLKRAKKMGITMVASPSLREEKDDLPVDVWEHIEKLYSSGKSIIQYLRTVVGEDDPECSPLIHKFLSELEKFYNHNGHAITTHKRLQNMDVRKYDLVIIDEDFIFNSIIPNKTDVYISELKKIRKKTAPESAISKKVNLILKHGKTDEIFKLKKIFYDKKNYDGIAMGVDIPSLCSAEYFCYRRASGWDNNLQEDCVSFMNQVKLSKDAKYIMVSATVDEQVCELYLGKDNMVFHECMKAEYEGVLNQYYDKSMSRTDIDKDNAVLERIKKLSGFMYTITFMKYHFGELHFGNTAGCDFMKGKNIDVIGTPHQPEWIYKLFAYSLGLESSIGAKLKPVASVEHNGYRFRFTTYDDLIMRAIQFYIIESELEQAVGRARLLRKKCTVNLFSNFPLSQAVMKEFDYGKLME